MSAEYISLGVAEKIVQLEESFNGMQESALQLDKIVKEKQAKLDETEKLLEKIKKIIDNEKITGIEAKLMIKDLFEKENK